MPCIEQALTTVDVKQLVSNDDPICVMSVEEVRKFCTEVDDDVLSYALDNAQGRVYSGERKVSYLIIKVVS